MTFCVPRVRVILEPMALARVGSQRTAMESQTMRELFYPKSVVVVGVSTSPTNMARGIVFNLTECRFKGVIYQVGRSGGVFAGRRIYPSVLQVPDELDMAVILTPAPAVPGILEECGQRGIRWAIIESGGFREYGEVGRRIEEEILKVAAKWGIRFVGPNCIGIINMENGFSTPFPPIGRMVKKGDISVVTQSGGVGISVLHLLANEGLGLNKFVSVGNMLDIQTEQYLDFLIQDPGTKYIFLYLEGIRQGRSLMEVAMRSSKPIVAFKANIGRMGKRIASSHSASLSSDDRVVDAAFRQAGIIRVHDATTLGNDLKILRLPPMRGRNLAIMSRSGGHAVIAADACETSGLNLVEFPREFLEQIEAHFRASVIKLTNPLDLGDLFDMEVYAKIIDETLARPEVDGIVFLHTFHAALESQASRELFSRVIRLSQTHDKPVALYVSTEDQEVSYLKKNLEFPVFTQVVETIRALELNRRYHAQRKRLGAQGPETRFQPDLTGARNLVNRALEEGRDLLLQEALELLSHYGIPVARGIMGSSEEELIDAARTVGFPVALKVVSPEISHKSDAGGVALDLKDDGDLIQALRKMKLKLQSAFPQAGVRGYMLQPMVARGKELILGGTQDEQFGPVVLAGIGGIFVEILGDVSLRVAPISRQDAREMLEELRGSALLKGARGESPSDLEALVEMLSRLSQLMCEIPQIRELDMNPVRVFPQGQGALVLDARVILRR
jgi:acyl-CoA synthetase (NDP forming)